MKKNPKVSIMLPSFNHGKFIKQTIDSILSQSYTDFEVIFSDDASTDDTMEVVGKFDDPRIIIHKFEENQGASLNGKYIYSQCSGEYIALCNSDDVWEETHLEKAVRYLEDNPSCGATFSWIKAIDEENNILEKCSKTFKKENRSKEDWSRYLFCYGNCLCHPSVVIRKEVYDATRFYNTGMRQLPDFYMWTEVVKKYDIYIIPEVLVAHRRHIKTLQNTSAPKLENSIRDVNESIYILEHYFDGMSDEFFIKAFSPMFRNKTASTHNELTCEKYFLLLDNKYYMKEISYAVAHRYFLCHCDEDDLMETFSSKYQYSLNDFFEFGAQIDLYNLNPNLHTCKSRKKLLERFFKR